MKNRIKTRLASAIVPLMMVIIGMGNSVANAASNWGDSDEGQYITVYQHCGFKGGSKRLTEGEYRHIKKEGIPNDEISSIRIPAGMSVKIYKHTKFKGASQQLNNSVRCLQNNWNDEISSLKVRESSGWAGTDTGNEWGTGNGGRCTNYRVSTNHGDGGFRLTHDPKSFQQIKGRAISGQICNRNNVQVELSKTDRQTGVLLEISGRQYRFAEGDGGDKYQNNWYRKYYTVPLN